MCQYGRKRCQFLHSGETHAREGWLIIVNPCAQQEFVRPSEEAATECKGQDEYMHCLVTEGFFSFDSPKPSSPRLPVFDHIAPLHSS
jgi:hypothetical protein